MQTELTLPDEHVDLHLPELRSTQAQLTSCSKPSQTCHFNQQQINILFQTLAGS